MYIIMFTFCEFIINSCIIYDVTDHFYSFTQLSKWESTPLALE